MNHPSSEESSSGEGTRREQRRLAIMDVASQLFAQEGYAGCEMERVALELKVAKGTLYLYFSAKQELFFACADWGMRQMQERVRAAADTADDPLDRISRGICSYLAFYDQHPHFVELIIQERAIFRDRKRPTYFEHRDAYIGYWRDLYEQLIRQGRFRSDISSERMSDTIGSLLYGTMFTNHFAGRNVTLEEQTKSLLAILFGGLLSDAERSKSLPH